MKVGILGYGSIGKRHAANALALGHDVKSYDPLLSRAENRNEVIEWADKIVIASPTNQHIQDIIDCNTHKKPMLVEKPIAHAWSGALNSKYIEMVGYNLRFHPIITRTREIIHLIGNPRHARFVVGQVPTKLDYLRDGVTLNWSHEIDLALHLLGPAIFRAANVNQEDSISDILLTHGSGCQTSIHLDYVCDPWVRRGDIFGDKGKITYDLETGTLFWGWASAIASDGFDASYVRELTAFLNDRDGGASAQDALHVLSICLKAKDTR